MNEEIQTTEPTVIENVEENTNSATTENAADSTTTENIEDAAETGTGDDSLPLSVQVTSPIDNRQQTIFRTSEGEIHVIHEITLGDVILSTLILAMLIFQVLSRVIRR